MVTLSDAEYIWHMVAFGLGGLGVGFALGCVWSLEKWDEIKGGEDGIQRDHTGEG